MKSSFSFPRKLALLLFFLSTLAFIAAFWAAYQQDVARIADLGNLAWQHLCYAEELNDDMAVIDWSKNLEKLDDLRVFQVAVNSKIVAEGGNRGYLPSNVQSGVSYLFPSDWSFQTISTKGSQAQVEFTLVFHNWPGPFFWGLFAFWACAVTGWAMGLTIHSEPASSTMKNSEPTDSAGRLELLASKPQAQPSHVSIDEDRPYLFIDKNYVIRRVSKQAAGTLHKNAQDLLNGHLLDLVPDPLLIQAFEKGKEEKIMKPFPAHPKVSAALKPDPNGYLLILEEASDGKPL